MSEGATNLERERDAQVTVQCPLLADANGERIENDPADHKPEPETTSHVACIRAAVPIVDEESDDPAACMDKDEVSCRKVMCR